MAKPMVLEEGLCMLNCHFGEALVKVAFLADLSVPEAEEESICYGLSDHSGKDGLVPFMRRLAGLAVRGRAEH